MMYPRVISILLLLLVTACSSKFSPFPKTEEHIVGSGDTVYSIAFEYDLDYRALAQWNDIKPPYKIYNGQMLVLHEFHPFAKNGEFPTAEKEKAAEQPRKSKIKTRPISQANSGTVREVKPATKPATATSAENKVADSKSVTIAPPPAPVIVAKSAPAAPKSKPAAKQPEKKKWDIPKYDDPWIWPVRGKVIDPFSGSNKGINISGKPGEPVRVTSAGKVVYAGEGLKGYGLLIIVKHDQNYLSAYGHNERLLVVQGETVKQGQPIATVGRGPENVPMVHFELRRNGKPVNPQKLLPK